MDANVQVALIEKAKRVFAHGEEQFLSFPLVTPVTFDPAQLPAILAPQSPADYAAAADFARIVNFVPRDAVATPDGQTFLWEIYGDVLQHADHATGRADAEAEARHAANQALLYAVDPDGTRHESPAYLDYRRYRDAWFAAQENYNAQRLTGEAATDPADQQQWHDVTEPALRGAVAEALSDWQTLGRRGEIEAAIADEVTSAANDPGPRWSTWQSSYDPNVDLLTAGTTPFAPTGFSPTDLDSKESWLSTILPAAEIDMLVAAAPPELRVGTAANEIEEISFDFRSVAITRPWFNSDALTSHIWRDTDGQYVLNDGADPPAGRLPAYVTALVLVRNVLAKPKAAAAPVAAGPLRFTLAAELLTKRTIKPMILMRTLPELQGAAPPAAPSPAAQQAFKRLQQQSFTALAPKPAITASLMRTRATPFRTMSVVEEPSVARTKVSRFKLAGLDRFRLSPFLNETTTATPAAPPPPPPPQPDPTISVLAFICKRLPKAPDPLPDLTWS